MVEKSLISSFLKSRWAVVFLCFIWVIPGLIGHDPWKADEPYSFGMVYHVITTGDWVVPTVAGVPFMEKPPLFYLTAAVFAKLFSPFLPLHDGARFACAFFMIITFIFTALAARELYGKGYGRIAVLILLGCVGLVNHAHKLMTDVSLLAGFAISLYGLILSRRRPISGGILAGTGVGIGFMSKGLLAPGLLGVLAIVLPFWCREWRNRSYPLSLVIALGSAMPWFVVWPFALYRKAPLLFKEWFWVQNFGRFFGNVHQGIPNHKGFYLLHLPYFAWPAFPLALYFIWSQLRSGKGLPLRTFPVAAFTVMLVILSCATDARALYALPMLLPLSLMAVPAVAALPLTVIRVIDKVNALLFCTLAILLWLGWFILQTGYPSIVMDKLRHESPAYIPSVQPVLFTAALLVTVLWLVVERYRIKSGEGVVFRWASGLTMTWVLMMTIWLPFVDAERSYRSMVLDLKKAIPASDSRITGNYLGESGRAVLEYHGGIHIEEEGSRLAQSCNLYLMATDRRVPQKGIGPDWKNIWEGSRPGDEKELFILYQKTKINLHT